MKDKTIHPNHNRQILSRLLSSVLAVLAVTACTSALELPGTHPMPDTPNPQVTTPPGDGTVEPEANPTEGETGLPISTLDVQTPMPQNVPGTSPRTGTPASPPANLPPIQAAAIRNAISDLAERLDVDSSAISFKSVFADEFPASQLGCPSGKQAPDPMQALVSGVTILLEHAGETYVYHARASEVVYCGHE